MGLHAHPPRLDHTRYSLSKQHQTFHSIVKMAVLTSNRLELHQSNLQTLRVRKRADSKLSRHIDRKKRFAAIKHSLRTWRIMDRSVHYHRLKLFLAQYFKKLQICQ